VIARVHSARPLAHLWGRGRRSEHLHAGRAPCRLRACRRLVFSSLSGKQWQAVASSGNQWQSAHLQTPRLFEEPRRMLAPLGVPPLGAHLWGAGRRGEHLHAGRARPSSSPHSGCPRSARTVVTKSNPSG
jgi:hypothetical protein